MAIIKEAFYIPEDIAIGLASGIYNRFGGIVRFANGPHKGEIVKHLKPILLPSDSTTALSATEKIFEFVRQNRKPLVWVGIITGTATVIGGIYEGVKVHKRKRFQKAFKIYIDAIRTGELSVEIIENLEAVLSNIKTVNLKTTELLLLVSHIRSYTIYLAENNAIDFEPKENDNIIDLKQYLEMQKNILKSV